MLVHRDVTVVTDTECSEYPVIIIYIVNIIYDSLTASELSITIKDAAGYRSSRCVLYRGNGGAIDDERLGNDGAVCGRYPRRGRRSRYRRVRLRAGVDGHNAAVSVALERVDHLHGNGGGGQRPRLVERRDAFDWEKWIVPVGGLVVGMPLGIVVFSGFDAAQMRVAIGAVLVLAVIVVGATQQLDVVTDWIEEKDYRPGKIIGATAGLLAGILGGAVAVPGPPMIVYGAFMSASGFWTDKEMKATFTAFFGTLMLYRLGSLTYTGAVTTPLMIEAAVAVPMVFLGAWIGVYIFDHIPERIFQWVVLALLTVNAFVLLFTAIPEL